MGTLRDKIFNIKDLRVVTINKEYIEQHDDEYIRYFNEDVKFIVERLLIPYRDNNKKRFFIEYYTECITEEDLSIRESYNRFNDIPSIFKSVEMVPTDLLTGEEIKTGEISAMRIFKLLQDINYKTKRRKVLKK